MTKKKKKNLIGWYAQLQQILHTPVLINEPHCVIRDEDKWEGQMSEDTVAEFAVGTEAGILILNRGQDPDQ